MGFLSKRRSRDTEVDYSFIEENRLLRASLGYLKNELNKFKQLPLLVCEVKNFLGDKALIRIPNGNHFCVNVASNLELKVGDFVLVEQKSLTIVQKLEKLKDFDVESYLVIEKPNVSWDMVGGLINVIKEIREVVELPLKSPELFKQVGIQPPKGILLQGPPGTGKTLLAKAVATSTNANFIEVVAPELVQKFIGEGAKLVREIFQLAREKSPCIVFIDEIDSLATERIDIGTSGEREVQRTFMQFLTELDGFKPLESVVVIAATNRPDIIDQALLRPGRFDRIIDVPLPTKEGRRQILGIHTKNMNMDDVNLDLILNKTENFTGAEIRAICTEAGYFAIRNKRITVQTKDFLKAIEKLLKENIPEEGHLAMFG